MNVQRTALPRISQSNRWSQVFQRFVEASRHQESSECVPLEILSIHSSEKRTPRDGQVDWKMFIALGTLKGFLD